jgi:membrane protein implicated in regulation of membrane protease activity
MSACCCNQNERKPMSMLRRSGEVAAWAIPTAVLALMPKCPICLAAYVALWTGIGLTLSTATYLRTALLAVCVLSLLPLVVKYLGRVVGDHGRSEVGYAIAAGRQPVCQDFND